MTDNLPKLRSPIVLVHGLLGVSRIQVGDWTLASYFGQFPKVMTAAGNRVLQPQLSLTGGVRERAEQLNLVKPLLDWFDIPQQAFYDLTTVKCREFNEQVPDAAGVRYFSVAGRHEGDWWSPEWQVPHQIVLQAEGPNDGVVSVTSATYGESMNIWEGDHLSLISWPSLSEPVRGRATDRAADYTALIRRLADAGF